MRRPSISPFVLSGVMIVGAVSACSSARPAASLPGISTPDAASQLGIKGEPSIGSIPVITGQDSMRLPLDPYMMSPAQVATIEAAERKAEQNCILRYFPGISLGTYGRAVLESSSSEPITYLAPAQAARYGYHDPVIQNEIAAVDSNSSYEVMAVDLGSVKVMNNMAVPSGGCLSVGVHAIIHGIKSSLIPKGNSDPSTVTGAANRIDREITQNDQRVLAVNKKWSSCMTESGHAYSDPLAAEYNGAWAFANLPTPKSRRPPITAVEIKTAVADVDCRSKVNLYGVYWAVAGAYQSEWLSNNQNRALAESQQQADQLMLARSKSIIGD